MNKGGDGFAEPGSRRGISSGPDSLGGRAFMGRGGEAGRSGIRDREERDMAATKGFDENL